MTNLSKKLGEMNFDGLFTDVVPAVQVRGGIIRKQTTSAVTLKRGTLIKSIRLTGDAQEIDCRFDGIKGLVLRAEFVRKR